MSEQPLQNVVVYMAHAICVLYPSLDSTSLIFLLHNMTIETNNQVTLGGNPVRRGVTLQDPIFYGWWHAAILGHVGLCNFAKKYNIYISVNI